MSLYEGMFLMDNRQANRDWDGSLETLTAMLTKHGGTVLRTVKWGERRLAYEVNGRRRGTYVIVYFESGGEAPGQVYRECELSELIHRALILKIDKLPEEAPAAEVKPMAAAASDAPPAKDETASADKPTDAAPAEDESTSADEPSDAAPAKDESASADEPPDEAPANDEDKST